MAPTPCEVPQTFFCLTYVYKLNRNRCVKIASFFIHFKIIYG